MLENNRNQLEATGIQLASNKEQLHQYSQRIEDKEEKILKMKETIKSLERQVVGRVKPQLLEAEEAFNAQQQKQTVNGNSSRVSWGAAIVQHSKTLGSM